MAMRKQLFLLPTLLSLIVLTTINVNAQSYKNLEYRKWRFTVINPVGTNGIAAQKYTARYSINLLGGNHGGLDGVELGTLYNYNRYYSSGFQVTGLVNATGGSMQGFNIAGLLNYSGKNMSGIQVAGLSNYSNKNIEGIQAAGALNFAHGDISGIQATLGANVTLQDMEGIQMSGLFNLATDRMSGLMLSSGGNISLNDMEGLMISGLFNVSTDDASGLFITGGGNVAADNLEGLMISSLFNIATDNIDGLLITGGLNYAENQNGLLISGGANIAQQMNGLQIGGLFNYANKATGMQIGLLNVAHKFNGASLGLFSIYGNGRKNIDVRFSDAGFTDFAITTGTHRFYNAAIFGINPLIDRNIYRVGAAFGLEKNINDSFRSIESDQLFVNQEFSVLHHFEDSWNKKTNLIFSYKYLIGHRLNSGVSIYAGPTYNMQVSRVNSSNDYTWYSIWSPQRKGRQYRFWVGFTAGIRLFKQKNLPLIKDSDFDFETDW